MYIIIIIANIIIPILILILILILHISAPIHPYLEFLPAVLSPVTIPYTINYLQVKLIIIKFV